MPDIIQIQKILQGYRVETDHIQSAGNMTVIPILGDTEFTNVADANEVTFTKDRNYNQLEFQNSSGHVGIAIQGWTLIDNQQRAQDRTLPYAHLVKAANSKILPANCIQHTQGGHFDESRVDQDSFMVLPPSLRGIALKNSRYDSADVGALWDPLRRWVKGVDCDMNGLTAFFTKFENRLDQFVAQFEPVDKQLGAIVLINGQVVSIDIMPKYETWNQVWRALIRDSYGAEAIRIFENVGAVNTHPVMDLEEIDSLDDLTSAYEKTKTDFYQSLEGVMGNVVSLSVAYQKLETLGELSMLKFESDEFIGQGTLHGDDHFVYLSLVAAKGSPQEIKRFQSLRRNPYGSSRFQFGS